MNKIIRGNKRAQVTVFIIIAIVLVAGIIGYFLLRDRIFVTKLSPEFQPIENYFLDCVKQTAEEGKQILGQKGGVIYLKDFEPGSDYRPFSSQLSFNGDSIPYWYYASGNNILKEQLPTKTSMQKELAKYIEDNLDCNFQSFQDSGFLVLMGKPTASVIINDLSIDVQVTADLDMIKENDSARQTSHKASINTKLGKFFGEAIKIYNYEKQNVFLENYAVDVLRNYAPVDGVEISCAPKVWLKSDIDSEIKQALEGNMGAIKMKGSYYTLSNGENKYFVQNLDTDDNVNFLYSMDWPTRTEIWETKNGVLMAEPVGLQQGLGILGFCYVPYHFVYDLNYPVLIQLYDDKELFQFPVAVIIDKNKPREALQSTALGDSEPELCKYNSQEVRVNTYDNNLNPIEANIGFECLQSTCDIGQTRFDGNDSSVAALDGKFPQCVNGFITAKAEGYADKKEIFSTNYPGTLDMVLDRLYNLTVDLKVDGKETEDLAVITFVSETNVQSVVWPNQKTVQLSQGNYNVSVFVYRDGAITVPAVNKQTCSEVPQSGLGGIFGLTEEKCFDINLPSQTIQNSLSAGGKGNEYIIDSQLEMGKMEINVNGFAVPDSVEKLGEAYNSIEISPVYLDFMEK